MSRGFIWCKADVRGIYLTYLIVEEVSKIIQNINSRDIYIYLYKSLVQGIYKDTSLEFIIPIVFLGFMGDTSCKRTKDEAKKNSRFFVFTSPGG